MAYQKINSKQSGSNGDGGESILRWQAIGQEAEGSFNGFKAGKYGPKSLIDIGGRIYTADTVIKSALESTPVGSKIKVVYLGKNRGSSGSEYKNFDVYVDGPEQPQPQNGSVVALSDDQKYNLLYTKILREKGKVIADALAAATQMSNDKLGTLREAAAQVGVVDNTEEVPF